MAPELTFSSALIGESVSWPTLIKWLMIESQQPILEKLEVIMGDLNSAKAKLEANSAKISEIGSDVSDLMTSNQELQMKVQELLSQQPDNQTVQDIVALADQQADSLSSIADRWTPANPANPAEPPAEPPVEPSNP